jgi:hypothetical protein
VREGVEIESELLLIFYCDVKKFYVEVGDAQDEFA